VVLCVLGGLVAAEIPALREPASELLAHADADAVAVVVLALLNAVAEELFFRGALYDAVPASTAVATTAAVYAVTTLGSDVVLLTVAAVVLGVVTALLRRSTGGVLAPIAAHVTWSTGMLLVLPSILGNGR
jgi:membrane protease YdiL (CAAX protease family)